MIDNYKIRPLITESITTSKNDLLKYVSQI
jgi:hypothetical protein